MREKAKKDVTESVTYLGRLPDLLPDNLPLVGIVLLDGIEQHLALMGRQERSVSGLRGSRDSHDSSGSGLRRRERRRKSLARSGGILDRVLASIALPGWERGGCRGCEGGGEGRCVW